ncbi:hypothetical protein BV25DRAFT_384788 [Artomyces pyxidatus]|uniref:Uncharacterized protein n=1 Tax=Artomyces pyxidatus TaxID=48021 RepID=A0ACB8T4V2_9AGAM|nr:hypothetical protein BV25DRAFT_384788 [Artomyces pyxidatus]
MVREASFSRAHYADMHVQKAKRPSGKRKRSSSPAPVLPDHSQTSQSKKPTSKRAKEALPKASAIEPDTEAPARKEKRKVTFEDLLQNSHHSDRSAPTTPKAKVTKPASSSSRAKLHTVDAGLTVASSSRLPNIPVDNRHPPSKSAVNTSTLASMGLEAHVKSERKKKAKKDPSGPDPPSSFTLTALPARISVASSTDILQKASNNPSDIAKASIPRKSSDANLRLPPEKEHRKRKRSTEDLVPTHVLGETPAKKKRKKKRGESIPLPGADGTSALVANIDTPAASSSFSGLVGGPATDVVPFSLPTSTSRAKRRKSIGDAGDLSHPFSKNPLDCEWLS